MWFFLHSSITAYVIFITGFKIYSPNEKLLHSMSNFLYHHDRVTTSRGIRRKIFLTWADDQNVVWHSFGAIWESQQSVDPHFLPESPPFKWFGVHSIAPHSFWNPHSFNVSGRYLHITFIIRLISTVTVVISPLPFLILLFWCFFLLSFYF